MAGASAVAQLAGGIPHIGVFVLLVWTRSVIAGMATGAVRLKGCELPYDKFRVGLVTFGAGQVPAVVLWLIRQRGVPKVRRCPGIRVVANIAFLVRQEMSCVLSDGGYAVVAGRAGTENLRMIHCYYGRPCCRAVTILANIRREYVRDVLTGCIRAVVATRAVANDACVIECGWGPGNRRMTVVAVVTARNMRRVFASCGDAIMTAAAASLHL